MRERDMFGLCLAPVTQMRQGASSSGHGAYLELSRPLTCCRGILAIMHTWSVDMAFEGKQKEHNI